MSDLRGAVREAIWDAIASMVTVGLVITVLVVSVLFLGAYALSTHRLIAAAMRAAGLLTVLTWLTIGVLTDERMTTLDTATTSWFLAHRSGGFDVAASVITDLGGPVATAVAGVICGVLLSWRARSVIPGVAVIGTVAAATLTSTALKAVVARPRPPLEWQLTIETDHSFPSGHVTGTAALLGMVAVCVGARRSRTVRAWLAVAVVAGVIVIAATRLYLGVHWLTDVTAAAILAGAFVIMGAAVFGAVHRRPAGKGQPDRWLSLSPRPTDDGHAGRADHEPRRLGMNP